VIFSNNVQNTHSNNSNNISNNNHYYAYSKQPINSAQNNILNNNSTLNLKDSTGIIGSYVPSYTNGAFTPSHHSAKSFAVSSAALTANKSKFKHRMSASSVAASIPYNTSSNPVVTNSNDNSICDNNQTYNFDPNLNSLKSSSSASLTLYTYLLQTNKNIGRDVKSSVIRSQTKKLTRNSPGPGKELINFISSQSWLIII
jgi:hypothetical protein